MPNPYFLKVSEYLLELGFDIRHADAHENILVVDKPELGIRNLVVGCGDPLLILEQYLLELPAPSLEIYRQLLQKNRDIIHGAFALDDTGRRLIFRDTLQIDSLDLPSSTRVSIRWGCCSASLPMSLFSFPSLPPNFLAS